MICSFCEKDVDEATLSRDGFCISCMDDIVDAADASAALPTATEYGGTAMTTIRRGYGRAKHGTGLPTALVRDVWALVSASPQLGMRPMGQQLGVSSSQISRALRFLRSAGYVQFTDRAESTRRVVVPLIEAVS